jgi:hypothetical protein
MKSRSKCGIQTAEVNGKDNTVVYTSNQERLQVPFMMEVMLNYKDICILGHGIPNKFQAP